MVMLNLVAALALGENAGSLVSEKPVISLNLEGMAAKLEKASADSEKLCHTQGEWGALLHGGERGYTIPKCLHDGSGVNLIHAVRWVAMIIKTIEEKDRVC